MPSEAMPSADWHPRTNVSVRGPKIPSTCTGGASPPDWSWNFMTSWTPLTASPVLPFLTWTMSFGQVSGPTMPSAASPWLCWNDFTADSVFGPKIPSTATGWLRARSRSCSGRTGKSSLGRFTSGNGRIGSGGIAAPLGSLPTDPPQGAFPEAPDHRVSVGYSAVLRFLRAREDLQHDLGLRVGVLLHVLPVPGRQLPLRSHVEVEIGRVLPQPVAKARHLVRLGAARREDVEVDVRVGALEQAVLEPVRLADREHIPGGLETGEIRVLVRRVGNLEDHVDDRLRRQAGNRRRAHVLDADDPVAEDRADALLLARVEHGPLRVVLRDLDL